MNWSIRKLAWIPALSLLIGALAILQGCTKSETDFPIVDSGLNFYLAPINGYVQWIDKRRVVFVGYDANKSKQTNSGGRTVVNKYLYEWDMAEPAPKIHSKTSGGLCVSRGYISFGYEDTTNPVTQDGFNVIRRGIYGEEAEERWPLKNRKAMPGVYNSLLCKMVTPPAVSTDTKSVVLLYPEDGHLEIPRGKALAPDSQVYWFAPGATEGVALPIPAPELDGPFKIRYSEYAKAYVLNSSQPPNGPLHQGTKPWPKNVAKPVYLLKGGNVTKVEVPYGKWIYNGNTDFEPSPKGLFISTMTLFTMTDPGDSGIWLYKGGQMIHLVKGMVEDWAMSPDGCNLAFAYRYSLRQKPKLKLMKLCGDGKTK